MLDSTVVNVALRSIQKDLHTSVDQLETGVRFLPTTVLIVLIAPVAGRVADRIGSRGPMVLGLAVTAVALYLFSRMDATTTYSDLVPAFILLGIGIGMTMSPMSTAAMNAVAVD